MDIRFLGANQTVTGSKTLLSTAAGCWLIDCGLYQGYKSLRKRNRQTLPFDIDKLAGIVLTHAHLDHSGLVPLLYRNGYRGPVYCSEGTAELCGLLWPDSGYLQEEEAYFANKYHMSRHDPALPLYTKADAEQALELLKPITQNSKTDIGAGLQINIQSAGHILGACSVYMEYRGCRVGFSGDLGADIDPVMLPPEARLPVDYLVVESTYGDRLQDRLDILGTLAEVINRCSKNGGTLLIPSFAVGRAQMLMHLITRLKASAAIPDLPVYLDSPMAISASELYCKYLHLHRLDEDDCANMSNGVHFVRTPEESKILVENNYPKIVISASGMATGGRVLHHLKKLLPNHRNTILLAGYQAGGTRGARLERGEQSVKIHGQYHAVKATVEKLHGLSAHADQQELVNWLKSSRHSPKRLFINHGDADAADSLRLKVEESLGWQVDVPEFGDSYHLTGGDEPDEER